MIHTNICWVLFNCEKRCEKSKFSMAENKSRFFQWNWLFSSVHTYVYNNGRLWIKKSVWFSRRRSSTTANSTSGCVMRLEQNRLLFVSLVLVPCYCTIHTYIRWYTWRRAYQHSSMNKQDGWMHSTPTQWQPLSLFNQYIRMGRKMSLWFWQWCTHEPIFTLILFITVVFLSGLSLLLIFFFAFAYLSLMIIIYNCLSRIKEKGVYTWLVIFVVVCSSLVDSHTHGGNNKT